MRVVLDTNVLISASLKPGGLEGRIVAMATEGALQAFVTEEVLAEYRDVFDRDKFRAAEFELKAALVVAEARVSAATDEDDNRFLECAAAASADYLITGNLRHYPAAWGSTKIVNARRFFDLTSAREETDCRPDP
jgi:uncharacterized protein